MLHARTWNFGFLAAAIVAAATTSANAALDFNVLHWNTGYNGENYNGFNEDVATKLVKGSATIKTDDGERQLILANKKTGIPDVVSMKLDNMYAYGGKSPTVISNNTILGPTQYYDPTRDIMVDTYSLSNEIVFDFNDCLSPCFSAGADGSIVLKQTTDGHLVLNIHFDVPTNISVKVEEGGVYSTKGNGEVGGTVGEVVVIAGVTNPLSKKTSSIDVVTDEFGGWSATAITTLYTDAEIIEYGGVAGQGFCDYQILVDNSLWALADEKGDYAFIAKKYFTITITPPGTGRDWPNVPEPASLGVLGLGVAGLMLRRRR